MGRSVITPKSPRCPGCQLPPRWCVCEGVRVVDCGVKVDVLMHHYEQYRPSSTGHLLKRVVRDADIHLFGHDRRPSRDLIVRPDKELWVLHPLGEPMPAEASPEDLQVLLLDGTWRQAGGLMRAVEGWGRRVSLPMTGESRYWLRAQAGAGKFCTAEALIFLLGALGLKEARDQLNLQFELHVYGGLCSRGAKALAAEFLATSPVRAAYPALLERLSRQRARDRE